MSTNMARKPKGWRTITTRIITDDVAGLVKFIKKVFKAEGKFQATHPTELKIGDSWLMVSGTEARRAFPALLYVYVTDVDATFKLAVKAGATSIEEPWDLPYGDRRGMVEDAWGNIWQIATFLHR